MTGTPNNADGNPGPGEAMVGQVVGDWRLDSVIGRGTIGTVFEGTHHSGGPKAAVKILKDSLSKDRETTDRVIEEARAAGSTGHPNIVAFLASGRTDKDSAYLAVEYLAGASLSESLKGDALPGEVPEKLEAITLRCLAKDPGRAVPRLTPHVQPKPRL